MADTNGSGGRPPLTYAQAGVDIEQGAALVEAIGADAASTNRPGVMAGLGGFGALFDLKQTGFADPVLVSGTDGVGTKLLLAQAAGIHHTVGIDLVAMCANDVLAQGAEPLFFLDYFATGRLEPGMAAAVVSGIAEGCRQAGCALIGGETAEMPGFYAENHYDIAGFVVGAAERDALLPRHTQMQAGDVLLALASDGPHSNGFSLVRKIVAEGGAALDARPPYQSDLQTLAEDLLRPTRMYAASLLPLIREGAIKGLAHITGGGLTDNVPRMCPPGLWPQIDLDAAETPPVFRWLAETGPVDADEMRRTFNMGIGMVAAVAAEDADRVLSALRASGETAFLLGELVSE